VSLISLAVAELDVSQIGDDVVAVLKYLILSFRVLFIPVTYLKYLF